jgi:5-aminolevulinate synthase
MTYGHAFASALDRFRAEGRYRVFADIRRDCRAYPAATLYSADGPKRITAEPCVDDCRPQDWGHK